MLDLGLSKMALIGVVALVVIGPKKLPGVARTAGALFGRAQRYVNDVKAEVMREIELDELRRMKTDFEDAAHNVQTSIRDHAQQAQSDLTDAWSSGTSVAADSNEGAVDAGVTQSIWSGSSLSGGAQSRRKNWRIKQGATPLWYKRASGRRTRVQSGAARVARHTPSNLRRPIRFF
jgi:sec-independent protein translocase protein TatB